MSIKTIQQIHLELVIADVAQKQPLLWARVAKNEGQWDRIYPENIRAAKQLKALCVLLLLAKQVGPKWVKEGVLPFKTTSTAGSWIKTLAAMRPTTASYLIEDLHLDEPFWYATRSGGESSGYVPPHGWLDTRILPLDKLTLFKQSPKKNAPPRQPLKGNQFGELAQLLEESEKRWRPRIVPGILESILEPNRNGQAKPNLQMQPVQSASGTASTLTAPVSNAQPARNARFVPAFLPREEDILHELVRELFYRLRKPGGEDACIALLEDYQGRFAGLCNHRLSRERRSGDFPLLTAISFGRHRVVDYLLGLKEIDVNQHDDTGITPLLKAARLNDLRLIQRLLPLVNKDVPMAQSYRGLNAIHEAAFGATSDALKTIELFEKLGVDRWKSACDNITPESLAISRKCSPETIEYLKDRKDHTLKHVAGVCVVASIAVPLAVVAIVASLLPEKMSLSEAVQKGKIGVVRDILDSSRTVRLFDINAPYASYYGFPLHLAVQDQSPEMVELLLRRGVDPFRKDNYGRTPREYSPVHKTSREEEIESILTDFEDRWTENEYKGIPPEKCFCAWCDMPGMNS